MQVHPKHFIRRIVDRWTGAYFSVIPVGKYIILVASLMHIMWATLLLFTSHASGSTPLAIPLEVAGTPWRVSVILVLVSVSAMCYPFVRKVGKHAFAAMLIPQQLVLLLSAGSGIRAIANEKYADGVVRGWPFILSDQAPIISLAILYTIAVILAAWNDDRIVSYS